MQDEDREQDSPSQGQDPVSAGPETDPAGGPGSSLPDPSMAAQPSAEPSVPAQQANAESPEISETGEGAEEAPESVPAKKKDDPPPDISGLDRKSVLEAALYLEDKPVSLDYLSGIVQLSPAETRALMEDLGRDYLSRNAGVQINEIAHGYVLSTASSAGPYLKHFYLQRNKPAFSRAAVETLAIIAYKQPVTRLEIESIRGAGIGNSLRVLLERKLVRIAGRKSVIGHPLLYATTREFLLYFGLKNLDSLPTIKEIREMEIT